MRLQAGDGDTTLTGRIDRVSGKAATEPPGFGGQATSQRLSEIGRSIGKRDFTVGRPAMQLSCEQGRTGFGDSTFGTGKVGVGTAWHRAIDQSDFRLVGEIVPRQV